jgi:hypothetical protein
VVRGWLRGLSRLSKGSFLKSNQRQAGCRKH